MTNEAAYALNRQVAEAMGYRFEVVATETIYLVIHMPEGQTYQGLQAETKEWFRGIAPAFWDDTIGQLMGLRDWARDAGAAIKLATSGPNTILVEPSPVGYVATLKIYRDRVMEEFVAEASTIAEAVCRAWLAWQEDQSSQK